MKTIKEIVEAIHEELEGAEDYAKKATQYKMDDKALADNYSMMAAQELEHVDKLHAQVVRMIKAHQATGKEVPAAMQAVWDYEHRNFMDKVAKIKMLLEMYRK